MADKYRSEVLYNPEDDLHYPTLTVRDTLLFALKTRTPDKESRLPGESRKEYQETFLSAIAKLFWIEHALDTKVGNELIRGISGGEKKRVSIAEALVTRASTQSWDNSTKGLDASTALEYVQSLRSLTDMANVSTLVALYQASETLYKLFDKVMFIEEGKCVYYGRADSARRYFESLGFECAPRWTTPDFLLSVTDPKGRRVKQGWEDRIPRTAEEFRKIYRKSDIYKATLVDNESFEEELESQKEEREAARKESAKKNYTVSFYHQVAILTHRQFLIMYGDKATLIGYLIPPWKMHPWLKWLIWINPVQYAFEGVMSNEFYNLDIQCEPPNIVPDGPNASAGHQTCAIQGSNTNQLIVQGSNYIKSAFTYSRSHLWRNFGIIIAWLALFIALTMLGMELQKPNKGGSSATIFKRGGEPETVKRALENKELPEDVETGDKEKGVDGNMNESTSEDSGEKVTGIARSTSIFTWRNLNYTIPYKGGKKQLLQDVQGYVKPGRLTALVGASGAGKTTLLNTLAQRVNFGVVSGEFLVDGRPLPRSFQRATGFAEQMDIHEPTATVRESLRFSALLRQPKEVPIQEKYDYCEKILDLLEMRSIAGATIGSGGIGLSEEQRKRLTIAVELASKPQLLLFLDEPTSGLDSLAAFNIVRFLRRLADAGQAILCTIHQPSAVLFEHFDDLVLLQSGGKVVYNGELGHDSSKLISYFERNGGKKCPPHANPAEYMLEVIGAGNPEYKGQDWSEVWARSSENKQLTEEIESIIQSRRNKSAEDNDDDRREYAMPIGVQVLAVTKPPPLIQQLQPRFLHFRNLYESREANSKVYSWVAFVTSAILPELPYSIVAGTIYFNCW
ncbi:hypothetical protein APSETT445_001611 [Aspergillus pseudonomiae]